MKSSRTENKGYSQTSSSSRSSTTEALRPNLAGSQKSSKSSQATQVTPLRVVPTHEQIAERAKAIWDHRGHRQGQDQADWFEAEAQLRAE